MSSGTANRRHLKGPGTQFEPAPRDAARAPPRPAPPAGRRMSEISPTRSLRLGVRQAPAHSESRHGVEGGRRGKHRRGTVDTMRPSSRVFPDRASRAGDDWDALDHRALSRRCRAQHERETRQIMRGTVHGAREVRLSPRACSSFVAHLTSIPRSSGALRDLRRQGREQSVSGAQEGLESRTPSRVDSPPPRPVPLASSQEPQTRSEFAAPELGKAQPVGAAPATAQWQDVSLAAVMPVSEGASPRKCATSPVGKQVGASIVCTPPIIDVAAVPSNDNPGFDATSAAPVIGPPPPGPERVWKG